MDRRVDKLHGMKGKVIVTESYLKSIIMETIGKYVNHLNEGKNNDPSNTHFAILKPINKIVFGWDYSGYDPSELRQFKKDYFIVDMIDNGFNPKDIKILTKNGCLKQGIDPDDDASWDNGFEYKS